MTTHITSRILGNSIDIADMRALLQRFKEPTVVDFDESMSLRSVRDKTRLWRQGGGPVVAFAYVDDYDILWFETVPDVDLSEIETEIVRWGMECIAKYNSGDAEPLLLQSNCRADDLDRISLLERHGFQRESRRSLKYVCPLDSMIHSPLLPEGFRLRHVSGEQEVGDLVSLHRAAFGTDNMTVEHRLAIMRAPQYDPELDLLIVAPDGELAAFCICMIDGEENRRMHRRDGYTDPIGTHQKYQRLGLGKAIITAGLQALKEKGIDRALLGTSSDNIGMQRLAEAIGFRLETEKLWFTKDARHRTD